MKQIEDNSLESARKKFLNSIFFLIISVIYLISPIDLVPDVPPVGYVDDILVLLLACIYSGYSYHRLKKNREKQAGN